ncbi:hypothetical protein EU348_00730 [Chryseobacterium indologenes]|uniref:Uncharacterized protein n=1 Tax=Chryseobacterium indologenes TaxID=253 RepID=A0A411DTT2_CHRID|nr:hypothetical protein EU348_00730 [Chryseobacterium indologenes]
MLDGDNKVKLKNRIDSISKSSDLKSGSEYQQIADFYKSYMDTATIEKLGFSYLTAI